MKIIFQKIRVWCLMVICMGGGVILSSAQPASVPEGYFTVNIAAGNGSSPNLSCISFPLQGTSSAAGQMVGKVTGITANTITNSDASWTAGQLSQAATPYLIQFTSGAAAGRTFLISTSTANTSTVLTIDSADAASTNLTTLGVVIGTDTYQIRPADTIASIFGTPGTTGVLDGKTSNVADQIQMYSPSSGWLSYYYNTTSGWLKVGPPIPSANVVIRPDTAVLYNRMAATPITITLMGRAPSGTRQASIANGGVTFLSNNWPANETLLNSNIQNTPGWIKGTVLNADTLQIFTSTQGWLQYYHNGTNWMRVGPPINSDNAIIPAGSAVIIVKKGSATGQNVLTQTSPYSI